MVVIKVVRIVVKRIIQLWSHSYTTLVIRVISGGVLLFSGVVKLPYIDTLVWEIEQYQLLSDLPAVIYGNILPFLEITIGGFLILGIWTKASALTSPRLWL